MDDGVDYMHPDLKFNYVSVQCLWRRYSYEGISCCYVEVCQFLVVWFWQTGSQGFSYHLKIWMNTIGVIAEICIIWASTYQPI